MFLLATMLVTLQAAITAAQVESNTSRAPVDITLSAIGNLPGSYGVGQAYRFTSVRFERTRADQFTQWVSLAAGVVDVGTCPAFSGCTWTGRALPYEVGVNLHLSDFVSGRVRTYLGGGAGFTHWPERRWHQFSPVVLGGAEAAIAERFALRIENGVRPSTSTRASVSLGMRLRLH